MLPTIWTICSILGNESMGEMKLRLERDRCKENHPCVVVSKCPCHAISQVGYYCPEVENSRCVNCGACVPHCPYHVFVLEPAEE